MAPERPLPFTGDYASSDEYIEELLSFVSSSDRFQIFCGGVHILDFFTIQPGMFHFAVPHEWHDFVLECDIMDFLELLVREDLDSYTYKGEHQPPESLLQYIRTIRSLSLSRTFAQKTSEPPPLALTVARGMKTKKLHEVRNFAEYVTDLSKDIKGLNGDEISHYVDFGSGQNYLGRALASEPYNRHVIAVEGREHNNNAARWLDVGSGLASRPEVRRNKKIWNKIRERAGPGYRDDPERLAKAVQEVAKEEAGDEVFDFRPLHELGATYEREPGKGAVQYISGRLDSGDMSEVIAGIEGLDVSDAEKKDLKLMAISIHSCGNLSHYAIRSLILNEDIRAIAIVGCCYNLLTERLGPPTYKHPYLRPSLRAVNGKNTREVESNDPQGFPMSERFSTYDGEGVRLNLTARMMACQAVQNWTEEESEGFFTRHFYRAVLQKIFLDYGVVNKVYHGDGKQTTAVNNDNGETTENAFDVSTNPVIIGSVPKSCYNSFKTYVRAALKKLCTSTEYKNHADTIMSKLGDLTDEAIEQYEAQYMPRRKELSVTWSLMAFSAIVVESLIVSDRWTFLKEQTDVVDQAWVEPVFDFKLSPRNLVVVGIKK